jgi:dihydrofolate reductase
MGKIVSLINITTDGFADARYAITDADFFEFSHTLLSVLRDKNKTVYSSTLKTATWKNSTILQKVDAGQINSHKQASSVGLLVLGSLSLVAVLTEMGLIDDYYFCIQPVIAGEGERLFATMNLTTSRPLKYVDSEQLKSGVHIIHYRRVH